MIRAYSEWYLRDAMQNLGEALEYAVCACGLPIDDFSDAFLKSGLATLFGEGVAKFVSGLSGTELVMEVLLRTEGRTEFPAPLIAYDASPEYWCGYELAYFQWYTGRGFQNIFGIVPASAILSLYSPLHEAGEEKFVETMNRMIAQAQPQTQLQTLRRAIGYSQRILAARSGVSLRMIQQYEQRAKNINRASYVSLLALAKVLGCRVEDLVEYEAMVDESDG